MKYRWEIINWLIEKYGYKSYLEIGVKDGVCYSRVNCGRKTGVDITPLIIGRRIVAMSSDEFFSVTPSRYGIIFIDGDHRETQVSRDIQNALEHLEPGGTIVMHDCNPKEAIFATPERGENQPLWSGTAYRSFLQLRRTDPDLTMLVVAIDWGCGIIQRGKQKLIDIPGNYTWDDFDKNRAEWLRLISIEEFQRRFA